MDRLRSILDWIGRAQVVQSIFGFIKPFLWPALSAMLTGAAGYWQHQPLMWILMAAALVFMAVMLGIFFVGLHRDRKTPDHKLRYTGTIVNYDLVALNRSARKSISIQKSKPENKSAIIQRTLDKIQIGVQLHNFAHFPISAFIESASTEMEGLKPPRTNYPKPATTIFPGNTVFLMDDPIPMENIPCKKLEGEMDLVIKYGLPGKERYELRFRGRVETLMQPDGFLTGNYTIWFSDQI